MISFAPLFFAFQQNGNLRTKTEKKMTERRGKEGKGKKKRNLKKKKKRKRRLFVVISTVSSHFYGFRKIPRFVLNFSPSCAFIGKDKINYWEGIRGSRDKVRWREETKLMFSLKGVRSKEMAPRGRVTERWTARALGLDLERLDGKLIAS